MHKTTIQRSVWLSLMAAAAPLVSLADVKPAVLFADNMIIQRETQAPVWGRADAGEAVTVTGSWGQSAKATADADGKWMVKLATPEAGGPHTLTIQGNNTVEINNVLSGEVWFCSGQSNMDFFMKQLSKTKGGTPPEDQKTAQYIKKEIASAQDDQLRQFEVTKNTSPLAPLDTFEGTWIISSPQHNADFTATGYFFGRELRQQLNVPVALIKCAWGGSRVEPWVPAEVLQQDAELAAYYDATIGTLKQQLAGWDPKAKADKYKAALKSWEDGGKKGRKPRLPVSPSENKQLPASLFNAMVHPVIPYAIKGAIWYQGESNEKGNTFKYETNLRGLISGWRKYWGQGDFPFYIAQLASFKDAVTEPRDFDGWASICDQQRRTLGLKNTGMAVLHDIGEAKDIHPHNKVDVGKRLALWALKHDYKQELAVCSGPLYQSHAIEGNQVVITFDSAGSGLMTGSKIGMADVQESTEPLKLFQICGADRQWQWGQAEITGNNQVTVSHPDIAEPTLVRYAWASNASAANLYNKEGLPASIFTTEVEIPKGSAVQKPAVKKAAKRAAMPAAKTTASVAKPAAKPTARKVRDRQFTRLPRQYKALELTPEQTEQALGFLNEVFTADVWAKMGEDKAAIKALGRTSPEARELNVQLKKFLNGYYQQVSERLKPLLTPEQQAKLK
jgi:sialate O-acetylesterase